MLFEVKDWSQCKIGIIGLGYVGLPALMAFAEKYNVVGFDVDSNHVSGLNAGCDRTGSFCPNEIWAAKSRSTSFVISDVPSSLTNVDFFIVTVPTPVTKLNEPDLAPLAAACEEIGNFLRKGAVVVFESTVYPGCT